MSIVRQCRKVVQQILFGDTLLPQEFFIGLPQPQMEIAVWLHGMGPPLDITCRHSMACAAPFTICIAFDEDHKFNRERSGSLSIKFCERDGQKRVLGEVGLKPAGDAHVDGLELSLFAARSSANYCLTKIRLGMHYLLHSYTQRNNAGTSGMKMSFLERRAAMVLFICPRPVALVSLADKSGGNIFPMNLMGDLGNGYFGFALRDSRRAAHLVERMGRIAVTSLPMSQASLAYKLAVNHTRDFIEWSQLPFATKMSSVFGIPVPSFAPRVREMEILKVQRIGSHTFFVARVIRDETFSNELELCVVHGFYQACRLKGLHAELHASLSEDRLGKQGLV